MLKELVGRSEVLGREYVAGWARVESGRCDSCDEFGPRARRDGDALCQECIGADYDMAGPSEIAEALGCMLFGGRALSWPRMRPLADAYRRAVGVALDDLFAPVVTIDDVVTVKCSHILGTTWNGFAVPVFGAERLAVALAECERVGWVRRDPSGVWVDVEYGEPVVTDLGNNEFILGEGWCWADLADDVAV